MSIITIYVASISLMRWSCREILQDYDQQMLDQQRLEQLHHLYSKALTLVTPARTE
jgi:hypothetical protein